MTVYETLDHPWLLKSYEGQTKKIPSSRYEKVRQRMHDRIVRIINSWDNYILKLFFLTFKGNQWNRKPNIGHIANFSSLRKNKPVEYKIYDSTFGNYLYCL